MAEREQRRYQSLPRCYLWAWVLCRRAQVILIPQFDVCANPSASTNRMYPYLLDIQSDTLSALATRIVVPLGRAPFLKGEKLNRTTPKKTFESEESLILILQITSLPISFLNAHIGTLEQMRDGMVAALDLTIVGF
ncbi:CcdB family protein [Halomonas denitrificans]|uniref:CcdB family protein n=1 Tax=Halomonas denitrificans TaxID=370769 RepID=UPI001CD69FEB|nr:CcdB family protein [Halomonas denitrificans]MCA0973112.1 CcdB family protein [Halomonas denitrificans]